MSIMKNDKSTKPVSDEAVLDLSVRDAVELADKGMETPVFSDTFVADLFEHYRPFLDRMEKRFKISTNQG